MLPFLWYNSSVGRSCQTWFKFTQFTQWPGCLQTSPLSNAKIFWAVCPCTICRLHVLGTGFDFAELSPYCNEQRDWQFLRILVSMYLMMNSPNLRQPNWGQQAEDGSLLTLGPQISWVPMKHSCNRFHSTKSFQQILTTFRSADSHIALIDSGWHSLLFFPRVGRWKGISEEEKLSSSKKEGNKGKGESRLLLR